MKRTTLRATLLASSFSTAFALAAMSTLVGCNGQSKTASGSTLAVTIDGSSTVFPIAEAISASYSSVQPGVQVPVSQSGTGSGFKKFLNGEIDIATASRPIDPTEVEGAKQKGFDFVELPIAFDGISIVTSKSNNWLNSITIGELRRIWEPGSKVNNWSDLRPEFPRTPMRLFGPDTNHGSFEYFTEVVNGKKKASRSDYTICPDYNILVSGVSKENGSLGYVGFAYYQSNPGLLKLIPVDSGKGPLAPSPQTISDGTYAPLSRPLFIYVSRKSMDRPEVKQFVEYFVQQCKKQVAQTGFVPLPDAAYEAVLARAKAATTGSVFAGAKPGMKIEDVLTRETAR